MGGEELNWCQLKHNLLMISQEPHFSPLGTAKTSDKCTNRRKNGSIGISDVVTASVYAEKTRLKKLMMMEMIIISKMNKSQETTIFNGRQQLTSAMKQMPEK